MSNSNLQDAIQQLIGALKNFINSGGLSEGSASLNDPHGGIDPEELLCESVFPGGEIHNAVKAVQAFYGGGGLPAPEARNPWLKLKRVVRCETDLFKRQIKAHRHAGDLRDWAQREYDIASGLSSSPVELQVKLGDYLGPLAPYQWAKMFQWSEKTFMRRVNDGKIHVIKLSTKSYRVLKSDIDLFKSDLPK